MKKYPALLAAVILLAAQTSAFCSETAADEAVFEEIYGTVKESVPPREIDKAAVELHKNYSSGKGAPQPQMGREGTVVYSFGSTVPRILCKPLRVTDVELEPGEVITNPPFIGDGVNWQIMPSASGKGENLIFHIMIKPSMPDISTNLIVHTDRRTYHMELVSSSGRHIPRVAFSYPFEPDDDEWNRFISRTLTQAEDKRFIPPHRKVGGAQSIDTGYTVTAKDKNILWLPTSVYNDGHRTYIVFPKELTSTEAPVFMLMRGKTKEMVNYRLKGNTYIIDYVVEKGILTSGSGRSAKSAVISRSAPQREGADAETVSNEGKVPPTPQEPSSGKSPFPLSVMNAIDSVMTGGEATPTHPAGENDKKYTFEDYLNERRNNASRSSKGK